MPFSGSTEYVGGISHGDTGSDHLFNSLYTQRDAFASRPATDTRGVTFIATDGATGTGAVEALYHDSGTTWALVGVIPAAENTYVRIATGSYTGDGAESQAIGDLGFAPGLVWITLQVAANNTTHAEQAFIMSYDVMMDDNSSGMAFDIGANRSRSSAIISLNSSGFTVDDAAGDAHPNKLNDVYNYMAVG